MLITIYLLIIILSMMKIGSTLSIPATKSNVCDFKTSGTDFNIEFKGLVKDYKSPTTFGNIFNYIFKNDNDDSYCVGEWTMKSTNDGDNYKLVYYGDIKNGMPHGVGDNTMITHTYNVENDIQANYFYTGSWKNGYKEGNGRQQVTFIEKNDVKDKAKVITIQEGNFINNDIVEGKEFSYVIENNVCSKYNGKFYENRPHGYGIIHHNNGTIFEGEFNHGKITKIAKEIESYIFNCKEDVTNYIKNH